MLVHGFYHTFYEDIDGVLLLAGIVAYLERVLGLVVALDLFDGQANDARRGIDVARVLGTDHALAVALEPGDIGERVAVNDRLDKVRAALDEHLVLRVLYEHRRHLLIVSAQLWLHLSLVDFG